MLYNKKLIYDLKTLKNALKKFPGIDQGFLKKYK